MSWPLEGKDPVWKSFFSVVSALEAMMITNTENRETKDFEKVLGVFCKFPREIREEIWGHVLDFKTSYTALQRKHHNALLTVSYQIRSEALPMLYRKNTFRLSHLDVRYQKTWTGSIVKTYSIESLGIVTATGTATYGSGRGRKIPQSVHLGLVKHMELQIRLSSVNWGDRDAEYINNAFIPPIAAVFDGNSTLVWESVRLQVLKGVSVTARSLEVQELLKKFGRLKTLSVVAKAEFEVENRERVNRVALEALFALRHVNAENIGIKIQFVRDGGWTQGIAIKNGDWVGGLKGLKELCMKH